MRYLTISELRVRCMFKEPGHACRGYCCPEFADTAVEVGGLLSFRCPKHKGIVKYNPDGTWQRGSVHHFIRSD